MGPRTRKRLRTANEDLEIGRVNIAGELLDARSRALYRSRVTALRDQVLAARKPNGRPGAGVLYVAPTKALAQDQVRGLTQLGVKRLREGRNMAGVPILNKLPYISRLFKNTGVGRDTESLMLMVTPRIIIQEEEEELLGIPTN